MKEGRKVAFVLYLKEGRKEDEGREEGR
jgi:hypothetical protein